MAVFPGALRRSGGYLEVFDPSGTIKDRLP